MKSFRFDDIWLLSTKERRARRTSFAWGMNLIVGPNHTGKSTLIKMLFSTLGATPSGRLERWDQTASSAVRFSLDDRLFRVVSQGGRRGLFDEDGKLLGAASNSAEWARIFAETVGYNLVLTRKKDETPAPADVSSFFLPFYIDQDTGWSGGWETFASLKQFRAPAGDILEYFSGIRPPQYYHAKAEHDVAAARVSELQAELAFLQRAQERLGLRLDQGGPKIDASNFEAEVARLTKEMTELNRQQEELRRKAVQEGDAVSMLTRQIAAAARALKDYEGDLQYMGSAPREPLVCPVCHAQHDESYLDLLAFADDARSLRDLARDLGEERESLSRKHAETHEKIRALAARYQTIEAILNIKRGDMAFRDVVESRGAEKAFAAFAEERLVLSEAVTALANVVSAKREDMKRWTDRKRKADIESAFKEAYSSALYDLNMPPGAVARLNSRPALSGSGGPRAMLAYYAALWNVCLREGSAFVNPIVIDSPNQQGQDAVNLPLVLEYVSTKLPSIGQVILGSELPVPHHFDTTVTFDAPYAVLCDEEYDAAVFEFEGPLAQMHEFFQQGSLPVS